MTQAAAVNEDSPAYVSPWGWWFQGDSGRMVNWPDPRKAATRQPERLNNALKPNGTINTKSTYQAPAAGRPLSIDDMLNAVAELERRHTNKAGDGFNATEIVELVERNHLQSVEPLLKRAASKQVLVMVQRRIKVPFRDVLTTKLIRFYNTPEYVAANGLAESSYDTTTAILSCLHQQVNNGKAAPISVRRLLDMVNLTDSTVRKTFVGLQRLGYAEGKKGKYGKALVWMLTQSGIDHAKQKLEEFERQQKAAQIAAKQRIEPDNTVSYQGITDKVELVAAIVRNIEEDPTFAGDYGVRGKDVSEAAPGGYVDTVYKRLEKAVERGLLYSAQVRQASCTNRLHTVYSTKPIIVPPEMQKTTDQMILEVLQATNGGNGCRLHEIVSSLGLAYASIRNALDRLIGNGKVKADKSQGNFIYHPA